MIRRTYLLLLVSLANLELYLLTCTDKLTGERTILFIGDSTMQQIAVTTMNIVASTGGKCGSQLSYGRSNYLVHDVKNVDRRWNHYHEESPVDIIIISAGPWYQVSTNRRTLSPL